MNGPVAQAILLAASLAALVIGAIRWLRVAQREHYLAGSVTRFARRWWSSGPNRLLGAAGVVGLIAAAFKVIPAGLVAVGAVAVGPFGLSLRGRTAKLHWTRRLRTLAAVGMAVVALLVGVAAAGGGLQLAAATATLLAVAVPLVVDVALLVTGPLERRIGRKFVEQAAGRLRAAHPTVVAITGSYGKTGTKGYINHLLTGTRTVVATPASFNNRAGLARALNEHLVPGTEVFVAEMGTYGPGEIRDMCAWCPPDIAVITAVGPVHLERMGTEDRIAAAKAEILERAGVAVINIDNPWLAPLAAQAEAEGKRVWRCSAVDRAADVCVVRDGDSLAVHVLVPGGPTSAEIARASGLDAPATNLACAVAVALELGVTPDQVAKRLPSLPTAAHRRQVIAGPTGATIIDDTYNANPAGAAAALDLLERLGRHAARRVVVTPGMVELGPRQSEENIRFAQAAGKVATDLLVVGQTNAGALLDGAGGAPATVVRVANREQAVAWVSARVAPGDVVLYENDLPDHFP
ncbi:MAG TPA: Mur ligase family protein [Acidimicrobiales bacterium]|nr:Mur ligase family protein [Acidimicrobiales bacterium]